MNERIRELKQQATRTAMWSGDPDAGELDAEKFAEMIVKECAYLTKWDDFDMCSEQRIRLDVYHDILKHFGVEE